MQNKKAECISEIEELIEEIKVLSNKNTSSIRNLKKYNIHNIENKISEIQQESARYIAVTANELKRLSLEKLEKIKNKFLNHIDKLLNQDLYLQQLSSKCSFLQENCYIKDETDGEEGSRLEKSESFTALLKNSAINISRISKAVCDECDEDSENDMSDNEILNENHEKEYVDKKEYDALLNEHMKALETIKDLKRKLVQKHEEENFTMKNTQTKKNYFYQQEKENLTNTGAAHLKNQNKEPGTRLKTLPSSSHTRVFSQQINNLNSFNENQNLNANYTSNLTTQENYYTKNYTNKQLWSYIFRLQTKLLEEVEFSEKQRRFLKNEIERQNNVIKQLMQEKIKADSYKSYSSLANYMELDSHEILELMKNAREMKNSLSLKRKLEALQKDSSLKIEKLMKEKNELEEENSVLRTEIETTKNESFYLRCQENEKDKNEKMLLLEKEKIEIEKNLLEIERNKLKTEKEELKRLRELAKLSENRAYFKK